MATAPRTSARPVCADLPEVFHHPALSEPTSQWPAPVRNELRERAAAACSECPVASQCLYDAVVSYDVAGFAAGTTEAERRRIRIRLGVRVEPENMDTLAGISGGGRPLDREEVLRLRQANPTETLEQLAMRLGCATSTVKRHLRKARRGEGCHTPTARPTHEQVAAAASGLVGRRPAMAA